MSDSTNARYSDSTASTGWYIAQTDPALFRIEMNDAFVVRLIPLSDLARSIAKAWTERDAGLSFEYRGAKQGESPIDSKYLQAVEIRLVPTFGLSDDTGSSGRRRLTREQYWKCRDVLDPKAGPVPAPPRKRPVRRKRAVR